ncbi:COG4948 L-alanine-DL-glutamate epimerase and related enzymes of enolase superfamily [Burkholderiales bacterium]
MTTRIVRVEVVGVEVPLVGAGFKNAYITKTKQRSAVVRITDQDGKVGLGNIDPSPGYSVETIEQSLNALADTLGPAALGQEAGNIHCLTAHLDQQLDHFLDAKAAIEMAATDLIGRRHGLCVSDMLGGSVIKEASFNGWIGIVSPEEAAAEVTRWYEAGWRSTKIKIGGDIHADRDRVAAVRRATDPNFKIRVDANAGYTVDQAIALGKMLEPYNLELMEQPVAADDFEGLRQVRKAVNIPIMADESITDFASLIKIIQMGSADIVKLKVMKQGGFLRTSRMLATAEAAGLGVVIGHGFGLGINTMAEILLASTSRAVLSGLECVGPIKTSDDIVTHKLDLTSGRLTIPHATGLGVTLDDEKLKRYQFFGRICAE